jgi:hypothetical protein
MVKWIAEFFKKISTFSLKNENVGMFLRKIKFLK